MLLKMNIKFWLHSAMASFLFCNLLAIRTTKIGKGNVLTGIESNEMNPNLIFQYWWHNCTRVNSEWGPFELKIKSCLHIPLHRSLFTYELNINSGNQFKLLLVPLILIIENLMEELSQQLFAKHIDYSARMPLSNIEYRTI